MIYRHVIVWLIALASLPMALSARAQLVSETVRDTVRVCGYAGDETLPDGAVVPRTFTVGIGQDCPSTAPFRDPNALVPPNAALLGEQVNGGTRYCRYGEGGVGYQVPVKTALPCAMTPALLKREQEAAGSGAR